MTKTLLIVDDDECLCNVTKRFFSLMNTSLEIRTATSPLEALNLVISGGIDFILSDFMMPQMNGLDFLSALRESGYDIPFIFLTCYDLENIEQKARENGALACFEKGCSVSVYYDILNLVNESPIHC